MMGFPFRPGRLGRARPGRPRIAVIGNCQGAAITTALRLLLPGAAVDYVSVYRLARRFPTAERLAGALRDYDHVAAMSFSAPFRDGSTFETLRSATGLVQIPVIVFSAYHPDVVYVGPNDRFVRTPVGDYNSAIALFGFLRGLSVEATSRLFRPDVYRALGYLGIWEGSAESLLQLGRDAGWDLGPDLARWARRGPFMHLLNHPRTFVTNDLARGLAARLGLAVPEVDLDSYVEDEIVRLGAFPVYPGVAEPLGLEGSLVFLQPAVGGAMPVPIRLRPFLEGSFTSYRATRRERLVSPRVEEWFGHERLVADLVRMAAE